VVRRLLITEHSDVPVLSILLGYGPMVPFVVGAALACVTKGALKDIFILCTVIWGGSTLSFLAGVRRGLSFRTESGPTVMQIASMFVLFVLALLSIVSAVLGKMIIVFRRGIFESRLTLYALGPCSLLSLCQSDIAGMGSAKVPALCSRHSSHPLLTARGPSTCGTLRTLVKARRYVRLMGAQ
jgi:hypothetical protein